MIQPASLRFKPRRRQPDAEAQKTEDLRWLQDAYWADKFLLGFTLLWVARVLYHYPDWLQRPQGLYTPHVWLQHLLLNELPPYWVIVLVGGLIGVLVGLCYRWPQKPLWRLGLFGLLLWYNALEWGWGHFAHVGHLLLLAHLFRVFLVFPEARTEDPFKAAAAVRWWHLGLLMPYSLSGAWKVAGLLWKTAQGTQDMTWLQPNAAYSNAIVSLRIADEPLPPEWLYDFWPAWTVAVLLMMLLQLLAFLGAFNRKWGALIAAGLVLFHLHNTFLMNTVFWTAPITLVICFFPYHLLPLPGPYTLPHRTTDAFFAH